MGIKDFLPALKTIQKNKNISEYSGLTVAVDGYCWLHQGAYTCATELAYGRGVDKLIEYCQKKVQLLIANNVTPIIILDGCRLVMKQNTEDERHKNRQNARKIAEQFQMEGNEQMARKKFQEAVDITSEIAYQFIQVLKQMKVEYYVAPYEADAQLAYMYLTGRAQVVITEDSDLLVFGVKRVLFKMDKLGNGVEIDLDDLQQVSDLNFQTFTPEMLITTCILSGCDYIDNIKGIGFKKAHRLVYENGTDVRNILKKIRMEGRNIIPQDYETVFEKALLTFKFQLVYCPKAKDLVHLNDPETHVLGHLLNNHTDTSFLGKKLDQQTAFTIATGDIDPSTHKPHIDELVIPQQQRVYYKKNNGINNAKKALPKTTPVQNQGLFNFFRKKNPVPTNDQEDYKLEFASSSDNKTSSQEENKTSSSFESAKLDQKNSQGLSQSYQPNFKKNSNQKSQVSNLVSANSNTVVDLQDSSPIKQAITGGFINKKRNYVDFQKETQNFGYMPEAEESESHRVSKYFNKPSVDSPVMKQVAQVKNEYNSRLGIRYQKDNNQNNSDYELDLGSQEQIRVYDSDEDKTDSQAYDMTQIRTLANSLITKSKNLNSNFVGTMDKWRKAINVEKSDIKSKLPIISSNLGGLNRSAKPNMLSTQSSMKEQKIGDRYDAIAVLFDKFKANSFKPPYVSKAI